MRIRLDQALVARGLCTTRQEAQLAIDNGAVLVSGSVATKHARQVSPDEPIVVSGPPRRFVSRGGEKLLGALESFELDVDGAIALDAGASTGGFTDCLLQHGARFVYAVDVGYGQLDDRLRRDERVHVAERTNVRTLSGSTLDTPTRRFRPVDVVVSDLSFISLTAVLPALAELLKTHGDAVLLIKPQFEVDKAAAAKTKGVIKDPALWRGAIERVLLAAEESAFRPVGLTRSPIYGPAGNTEFLGHFVHHGEGATVSSAMIDEVIAEADSARAEQRR